MLREILKTEIEKKGFVTFDRFVYLALYHPEYGYYTKKRTKPIPGEDFFTAPELSSIFGKVIANHIRKISEKRNIPLRILELGGGKGFLAKDILSSLPVEEYIILEKNNVAKEIVHRVKIVENLNEIENFSGFVISNEFFDAFPFKRIRKINGELREVVLRKKGNELFEDTTPFTEEIPCEPEEGCEYSLFTGWNSFLENLFKKFQSGYFLTIDYGDFCKNLRNRREGTFLSFRKNRIERDYLRFIGEVDLTSRVDFSHLKNLLARYLTSIEIKPQSEFLLSEGIERFLSPEDAITALTLIVDMGRKFKVLSGFKN